MAKSAAPTTRTRDPEGTRRKILAAALQEFSAKGIDGARVDAIAARARVNKQLLYYYFDSKDGLFRAVLRERLAERSPTAALADRTSPARHRGAPGPPRRGAGLDPAPHLGSARTLRSRPGRGGGAPHDTRTVGGRGGGSPGRGRAPRRPRRCATSCCPSSAPCCSRSRSHNSPNSSPARRRPHPNSSPIAAPSSCSWVRSSRRSVADRFGPMPSRLRSRLEADGRSALGRSALGRSAWGRLRQRLGARSLEPAARHRHGAQLPRAALRTPLLLGGRARAQRRRAFHRRRLRLARPHTVREHVALQAQEPVRVRVVLDRAGRRA